jgi:Flp pilus assembly pilin Flp
MGDGREREETGRVADRAQLGQGLIEYALIIFLVAIVVIAILLLLGPQIGAVFSSIYATI